MFFHIELVKILSLSEMMRRGGPWSFTTPSIKACATVSTV
jgi:hypothetical protein